MPEHLTYFQPTAVVRHDLDTGERVLEIDFNDSIMVGDYYDIDPHACQMDSAWVDRVLSVRSALEPTSQESIVKVVPGDLPPEPALEDLPPPPRKGRFRR